ncbi:MAG: TetR/AcrR family transcriptional regulator [Epsilonproteobacteria bacterium]|nr:TetR/AcrR family transcriptional regulator [Campylobacterota bacterium]
MAIKKKVKEYKRELVLKSAGEFLEKSGFEKAKMADIASYCGISVGALYNLFPSKEDLFYQYVNYQIDLFYKELLQAYEYIKEPRERIKFFIKLKFQKFMQKRALLKDTVAGDPLFFAKLNANKGNPAALIYELIAKEFEKISKEVDLKIKDYEKISYLLNSFTYGYIEYWLINDKNLLDFVDEAYELFMEGVVLKN